MSTSIETLVGVVKKQRIRTVIAGIVEVDLPSIIKGPHHVESMSEEDTTAGTEYIRGFLSGKASMKLDKRLTSAVFGMNREDAQASVWQFLESKGYARLGGGG